MNKTDGRYQFEVGTKKVVVELYTVNSQLYYDFFVDGVLLSKQGSAEAGEDNNAIIRRLRQFVESQG